MPTKESVDVFMRTLDERFAAFKQCLHMFLHALTAAPQPVGADAARNALQSAEDLSRSLSSHDQPPWLSPILNALRSHVPHVDKDANRRALVDVIMPEYGLILKHTWSFVAAASPSEDASSAVDFDRLYEDCREQSRVTELFDLLIERLEQIVALLDVDSRRVIQALTRIIETLKKNRRASYFSTVASWDFVISVFRKSVWAELCKIPVLGSLLTSLREGFEETDEAMSKLHSEMQQRVNDQITTELAILSYDPRRLPELPAPQRIEAKP